MVEITFDAMGVLGEGMIFIMFLMLQCGKVRAKSFFYLFANCFGSVFVLVACYTEWFTTPFPWNLGYMMVQTGWLLVSGYCSYKVIQEIYQRHQQRRQKAANEAVLSSAGDVTSFRISSN